MLRKSSSHSLLGLTVLALVGYGLVVLPQTASADTPPATSTVPPVVQRDATLGVTADALPTAQIDGVAWSEKVAGDTVYVGGSFANARPAGSASGVNTVTRNNLMAFSISTGAMTSWNPNANGQIKMTQLSPDGSTLYVGGSFTTLSPSGTAVNRYRIAAFNASTGALITSFAPSLDASVNAIAVSADGSIVYVGGNFSNANGSARSHLAAFKASNGALLGWAPSADDLVQALIVSPDGSKVIAGGQFQNVSGTPAYGLAALSATDGTVLPWAVNTVVRDAGTQASILSLSTDGTYIYSTAYVYGNSGNFEGVSSVDGNTGAIHWLADCHGDTYGSFGVNGAVYVASHEHFCSPVGGFPDSNPRSIWHRATAFTQSVGGLNQTDTQAGGGYGNFAGQPSPSLVDWLPDFDIGTYTGQSQGPWSVNGNTKYVVYGGEFLHVNGTAQQGLVRFGVPTLATNLQGPRLSGASMTATAVTRSATSVRVAFPSNYDRDDQVLTYQVLRDLAGPTPTGEKLVGTVTATSQSWNLPTLGFVDKTAAPSTAYVYRIKTLDPNNNKSYGNFSATVTTPAATTPDSAYTQDVLAAGASNYWRLDQAAGATTNYDYAGFSDVTVGSSVTPATTAGAIAGDSDSASTFNGSSTSMAATTNSIAAPDTFTEAAWFKTTSTTGGKIIGFGNASTGSSSNYDRHVFMDAAGHINFGVYPGSAKVITSPGIYNDGNYHQVVATMSSAGMILYIDGRQIGVIGSVTSGQAYNGYWRIGGDSSWSGANYFTGDIDEVAIYPTALSLAQIRQQYTDSGRTLSGTSAPADAYGKTVWNDSPSLYYRLDESTSTAAADSSGNSNSGTYYNGVVLGAASPVSGSSGTAATFDGVAGTVASNSPVQAPTTYSEEAWFNTTSTAGGAILGFGGSQNGNSNDHDRQIYLLANGQLDFGTYTGQTNIAQTTASYNDGKWHHVVATQGSDGMTLYVDGVPAATNAQTSAQSYQGYWRVGGDNLSGWSNGASYLAGSIDEVAIYNQELTAAQVKAHYLASPAATVAAPPPPPANVAPVAAFTATPTNLSVAFDGTGSTDSDGTVASYAWDFGDNTSGTGPTVAHAYAAAGTYQAKLTVTDNGGATNSSSSQVTVTAPVVVNKAPVAAFTATPTNLSVAFDGTGSTDSDGTVASYAWDFGDNTSGTGPTVAHAYAAAGTYQAKLTVTDNGGATNSSSSQVTVTAPVVANKAPTASFTATPTNLTVALDGTASSDSDGTVASYAWDFGDSATATGPTASHTYATAGTYTITLTVTDNKGLASNPVAKSTTVTAPAPVSNVVAADTFTRTTTPGWGSADTGGAWTLSYGASSFSTNGTQGAVNLTAAGQPTAVLGGVSAQNVNILLDSGLSAAATGTGLNVTLMARQSSAGHYRLKLRYLANGVTHLALSKVVAGKETTIGEVNIPTVIYSVGDVLRVRFTAITTGTSTALTGTVWKVGTTEPAKPQIVASDSEATLQGNGAVGINTNTALTTGLPIVVMYDNLSITKS